MVPGRSRATTAQPLADMRVELMHTKTRLLPEIWPNQTVSGSGPHRAQRRVAMAGQGR